MPSTHAARVDAEVLSSAPLGGLNSVTLAVRGIPLPRPGQLVAVSPRAALPGWSLPVVTWLAGATEQRAGDAHIQVVLDPRDASATWLVDQRPGSYVGLTGPLGRGFRLPATATQALLVGDGASAGVLLWLAVSLRDRGCATHLLLVGDTVDHVPSVAEAKHFADDITLATRDGLTSQGAPVPPETVLQDLLRTTEAAVAYIAGPLTVAAAWSAACERAGLVTQVGFTRSMSCGTGLCDGCRVPVIGADGFPTTVRLCTEGPVLPAGRVAWDVLEAAAW